MNKKTKSFLTDLSSFKTDKKLLIIFLILLSTILRFWNLHDLLIFTLDEELEAFFVKNIVTGFHFPAIGVAVAPIGIHLSPLFYYLAAVPFWIGNLDPLFWGYSAAFLGVVTTLVFYKTTKDMFSYEVSKWATLLYSSSFLMVLYDKHFWNVLPMPIVSIIVVYSLFKIINGYPRWFLGLFSALAVGFTSHLSVAALFFLVLVILYHYRSSINYKYLLISIALFLLTQSPLVIFELRHDFLQTKTLTNFLAGEHSEIELSRVRENLELLPKVFSRLIYTFGSHDFSNEHTYGLVKIQQRDNNIPDLFYYIVILILFFGVYEFVKNKQNLAYKIHFYLISITVVSLVIYGFLFTGNLFEFYLSILFPSLFILLALFINWLVKHIPQLKLIIISIIGCLIIANIQAVFTATHSYGYSNKLALINWVSQKIQEHDYELHSIGYDHKYEGYRYLFERFFKPPIRSYVDPQLSWLYQTDVSEKRPGLMVVISSSEAHYLQEINKEKENYLLGKIDEMKFGEISVVIVDSSKIKFNE